MHLHVEAEDLRLDDEDNFRQLDVRTHGLDEATLTDRMAAIGTLEGDHAWLSVQALADLGRPSDEEWLSGFRGMISYAASQGWTRANDSQVRAHLVAE